MRKLYTKRSPKGLHVAIVYRNSEWYEYIVKFFENGQHLAAADYHTDDKQDAIDTADTHITIASQLE